MRKLLIKMVIVSLFFLANAYGDQLKTNRIQQFSNEKVAVWKTTIYPTKVQELKMHRHEHDRVIVPLTDGIIEITNNKRKSHVIKLKKGSSIFLAKDNPKEMHTDTNLSGHPIEIIVVDLKMTPFSKERDIVN